VMPRAGGDSPHDVLISAASALRGFASRPRCQAYCRTDIRSRVAHRLSAPKLHAIQKLRCVQLLMQGLAISRHEVRPALDGAADGAAGRR
jgi:hypothetical protein